jgi:hypothetical protein
MSKKYVPSFLKSQESPPLLSPSTVFPSFPSAFSSSASGPSTASASTSHEPFPDVFPMKKHKKEIKDVSSSDFDAFPMNRNKKKTNPDDFDAFTKAKRLPENDAFSMGKKPMNASASASDFEVFGKKKKHESDSVFSKSSKSSKENYPSLPTLPPVSYIPGTLASLTATTVVAIETESKEDDSSSFASRFAQKMKIIEDPDYTPPPTIVNVSSEQEFPTLGVAPVLKQPTSSWNSIRVAMEEALPSLIPDTPIMEESTEENEPKKEKKRPRKKENGKKTVLPKHILSKQTGQPDAEQEEFKPIEYDEESFEDEEEWTQSDLDEEEFFREEDDDEDDEDELNPNVYDDRRHRDDLY